MQRARSLWYGKQRLACEHCDVRHLLPNQKTQDEESQRQHQVPTGSHLAPDYFFRSRFALALARRSHGAISEAIEAWPKLDISVIPVDIAAAAFSLTMRWYSAGEHLFLEIRSMRRVTVSQDASVKLVITKGSDTALLFRVFMNPSLS
jgi:hypothetical protein